MPLAASRDFQSLEKVGVARTLEELRALEPEWRALHARTPEANPFQGFDWCLAWVEAVHDAGEIEDMRIVTVREAGRLVLLWPLAVRSLWGFRVAHWLAEPMTQYGDVLVEASPDRARWLEAAWARIRSWGDLDALELRRVRANAAVGALHALAPEAGTLVDAASFVDLAAGAQRGGRTRNTLKRRVKQLEARGAVRFEHLQGAAAQRNAVAEAFAFKRDWLVSRGLASAGLSHVGAEGCLAALAERAQLFVLRLGVGEETAALEIGLLTHGHYVSFMQSYAPAFAANGPGRLLFWHLVEHGAALGIETLDFLAPAYEHKREWATGEVAIREHVLPMSPAGRAVTAYLTRIKPALKDVYGRLPADARRRLAGLVTALN